MLMGVLMSISRGGSRETEFCTFGTVGVGDNPIVLMFPLRRKLHTAHVYVLTAVVSHAHLGGVLHACEYVHQQYDKPFQNGH